MTNSLLRGAYLALSFFAVSCYGSSFGQTAVEMPRAEPAAALCNAPQAQPFARTNPGMDEYSVPARKYAPAIEPGQAAQTLTAPEKLIFSFTLVARPIMVVPALYSAGYEQLFETDPKYGHDAGAFGEKFGAAMLRNASVRVLSNGVFAAAFHQDPRYYRIAHGSVIHRGLLAARQSIIRRNDDGDEQFNYSGIVGRAVAAGLVTTYYPEPSLTARVVVSTFLTSILTDAGGNMVVEFFPSLAHHFPVLEKIRSLE